MKNFEGVSDETLALLYVQGNNRAFDELLNRSQEKLFTYIMFVVHDHDIADDIFQDTFVKAITKLQNGLYTNSGKFMFWLTRIAHNCIMDWYRAQQASHIVQLNKNNDINDIQTMKYHKTPIDICRETEMVNEQILCDIKKMVDALPAPQREVVYMRYYQEMSFKDIANLTGVSINTALGRMRYAILNLRRLAKEYEIELAPCG